MSQCAQYVNMIPTATSASEWTFEKRFIDGKVYRSKVSAQIQSSRTKRPFLSKQQSTPVPFLEDPFVNWFGYGICVWASI